MSDRSRVFRSTTPFLGADERKERLDAARKLLDSRDIDAIRRAIEALPDTGNKSRLLRSQLNARCQELERRAKHSSSAPVSLPAGVTRIPTPQVRPRNPGPTVQVGEGHRLVFRDSDGDSSDLCSVRVTGGLIEVFLHRAHPVMRVLFNEQDGRLHDIAALLLSAWVTLELEAGSDRRREHVRDLRVDWSRVLTRLCRQSE